uniref:Bax inhibitor 1 n=2 Tax=Schistosoma mansoni TaxID=6183 RepID=A0A5K4F9F6_SCHMA
MIVYIVVLFNTENLYINMFKINQINQSITILINKLSNKSIFNYRLGISLYNKKIFIILIIQLIITFFISIIFYGLNQTKFFKESLTRSIMSVILLFITSVLALLIAFVKKISDTFPLNVIILFTYTIIVATTDETLDILMGIPIKLGAYGISLILFIAALLIGAAIKKRLTDYSTVILTLLPIIAIVIIVASFLITKFPSWSAAVVFYVLTDIASFFITIFVSQITVGKSALRIFCTEYVLAALLLYNMFSTTYLITTHMVCNINPTCNNSNASVSLSDNLPIYSFNLKVKTHLLFIYDQTLKHLTNL